MSPVDAVWKHLGLESMVDPDSTSIKLVALWREHRTTPRETDAPGMEFSAIRT
jgi:hypothetical protein